VEIGVLRRQGKTTRVIARTLKSVAQYYISRFLITRSDPHDEPQLVESGTAPTAADRAIAASRFTPVAL
jgi:hypothetical protein